MICFAKENKYRHENAEQKPVKSPHRIIASSFFNRPNQTVFGRDVYMPKTFPGNPKHIVQDNPKPIFWEANTIQTHSKYDCGRQIKKSDKSTTFGTAERAHPQQYGRNRGKTITNCRIKSNKDEPRTNHR